MTRDLSRLLAPRSVAVIGDAPWCREAIEVLRDGGYVWDIWPVHPEADHIADIRAYKTVADLPQAPDAAIVGGAPCDAVRTVTALAERGAGGAVLATGLAGSDDAAMAALRTAAGAMPILGPDCPGFINGFDRVTLWPGPHGLGPVPRGVAILTHRADLAHQVAARYRAQGRGLPVGYLATPGDAVQTGLAELAVALISDPRVTALGLCLEEIGDPRAFEALAVRARQLGKPIVVCWGACASRPGPAQARSASALRPSPTPNPGAGAAALLARLGMARVQDLDALFETLKLLHFTGPLPANQIAGLAFSQEAGALLRRGAERQGLTFAALGPHQEARLAEVLGPQVPLGNPLICTALIEGDEDALAEVFAQVMQGAAVLSLVVIAPGGEGGSPMWRHVSGAAARAHAHVGMPLVVVSAGAQGVPAAQAAEMTGAGVIPMAGVASAMAAIAAAVSLGGIEAHPAPVLLPRRSARGVDRIAGPAALSALGLSDPGSDAANTLDSATGREAAPTLTLHVRAEPGCGYLLTFDSGGARVEPPVLLPLAPHDIRAVLARLDPPQANGPAGPEPAGFGAAASVLQSVQDYIAAQAGRVNALEASLRIVSPERAVVTDARIDLAPSET